MVHSVVLGKSLATISGELGVSRSWASRLRARGLSRLRAQLRVD